MYSISFLVAKGLPQMRHRTISKVRARLSSPGNSSASPKVIAPVGHASPPAPRRSSPRTPQGNSEIGSSASPLDPRGRLLRISPAKGLSRPDIRCIHPHRRRGPSRGVLRYRSCPLPPDGGGIGLSYPRGRPLPQLLRRLKPVSEDQGLSRTGEDARRDLPLGT